jgi:DNA modification methylase
LISIESNGISPIHIDKDGVIVDGYQRVEACKRIFGSEAEIDVLVMDKKATIHDRIALNQYRQKTTADLIKEARFAIIRFPKMQGKKISSGEKYVRDEKISAAIGNFTKGDENIKKLEFILNNDFEDDLLSRGLFEKRFKLNDCFDFLNEWQKIDEEGSFGYSKELKDGKINVAEAIKFIKERYELSNDYNNNSFSILNKVEVFNEDCKNVTQILSLKNEVDLIFTSIPYWLARFYKIENNGEVQLGHEKTKEEFVQNIIKHLKPSFELLKDSGNVIINVGEKYVDGEAQGIPFLLLSELCKELKFKSVIHWVKKNPRPQGESVKRPSDSIEYLLWFVKDISEAKYNQIRFPVKGKEIKITSGANDQDYKGNISKKSKTLSKDYGTIKTHIFEQEIEGIIETSIGKNHEVNKISKAGHPALMSPMVPVIPILMLTDENDIVLDPFMGSATTGKIAALLNRKFIGVEKSKIYYEIGCKVLENNVQNFSRKGLDEINSFVYNRSKAA